MAVAGWTVDRTIRVRFPAYPHRVWALWWQVGKICLRTSRCLCRDRLGTLKTPSCPWRRMPGSRSKFGNWTTLPSLYSWNITECDVKPQPTSQRRLCVVFQIATTIIPVLFVSTVVLYCWCHSDSASVLLYFTFFFWGGGGFVYSRYFFLLYFYIFIIKIL